MPVWEVLYTNASGSQRFSAVRVAETADDAQQDFIATYGISEQTAQAGTFRTTQKHDPEGRYEQALIAAEQRQLENQYFRVPAKKMPWNGNRKRG
jgi:hypothetical protein